MGTTLQNSPKPIVEKQINGYCRRIDSENFILSSSKLLVVELQIIVVPV